VIGHIIEGNYLGIDLTIILADNRSMMESPEQLDNVFRALAHPVRRAVLKRLSLGSASVSELHRPFDLALPSFVQHLEVLSDCAMVSSSKHGRVRTYRLLPAPMAEAESWIATQRTVWERRLDQLDDYLNSLDGSHGD
jgi:DNA-binding transcriptional ArsR family regulator